MMELFNTVLFTPLFNLLIYIYNTVAFHDLGWSIVVLTIIVRAVLYPLQQKSLRSQRALSRLQPKIEEIKQQYKDKREEMGKAMMDLYKKEGINPLSSCLPLLIQLPFLIAIYWVFRSGVSNESLDLLYYFVTNPGTINHLAFGFLDLSVRSIPLALLAGAGQYFQSKLMVGRQQGKQTGTAAIMNKQMLYFMPMVTIFIGLSFPAGLTLYWFITIVLMILQQQYLFSKIDKEEKFKAEHGEILTPPTPPQGT